MSKSVLHFRSLELLGPFIGKTVVDIHESAENDPHERNEVVVQVSFDDGTWIKFPIVENEFWYSQAEY